MQTENSESYNSEDKSSDEDYDSTFHQKKAVDDSEESDGTFENLDELRPNVIEQP